MRAIDENTAAALRGSRSGDGLVCWVWYDGALVLDEPLPVSGWGLSSDGDDRQKVQVSLSLEVKDPDGVLAPWLFDDPLGVGGARVQVFYRVGGAGDVLVGWYRVTGNSVEESWAFRVIREDGYMEADSELPAHYRNVASPLGSSISVTAKDLTVELDSDEFLAPENPVGMNPTVMSEVERIVGDRMPVVWNGVTDVSVPVSSVWESNRLEAVMDLLALAGASFRVTGDGELECYVKSTAPVFECAGGRDGVLINISRGQSIDNVYNAGVVTSTQQSKDSKGAEVEVPIVAVYQIESGPMRVGGPFGRRVIRSNNPLMDTQSKAEVAARSLVLNRLQGQTIDLEVTCLPDPSIEVGDYGVVVAPVVDGRLVPLTGEVVRSSLSGTGGSVNSMQLTVRCLLSDVAAALKNYSIADRITSLMPSLTYDTVNPLRTMDEMNIDTDGMTG